MCHIIIFVYLFHRRVYVTQKESIFVRTQKEFLLGIFSYFHPRHFTPLPRAHTHTHPTGERAILSFSLWNSLSSERLLSLKRLEPASAGRAERNFYESLRKGDLPFRHYYTRSTLCVRPPSWRTSRLLGPFPRHGSLPPPPLHRPGQGWRFPKIVKCKYTWRVRIMRAAPVLSQLRAVYS